MFDFINRAASINEPKVVAGLDELILLGSWRAVLAEEERSGGLSPEERLPYRCGAKAANDLDRFIHGRPVSCVPATLDQDGRTVASCAIGNVDLGEWLVPNGCSDQP
jgi:hypothetical protein